MCIALHVSDTHEFWPMCSRLRLDYANNHQQYVGLRKYLVCVLRHYVVQHNSEYGSS